MSKIIVSLDGKVLHDVELSKERITIGRRPHNDVVIENLAVSGEHAVILTTGNDSVLEDLNSTNGTLVNGQPVKKHILQNNDVIELAKYRVKFLAEARRTEVMGDDDEAAVTKQPASTPQLARMPTNSPETARPTPNASPNETRQGSLKVMNGANAGKELALTKALVTLGRPGVQVAVITRRPEGYFITHVEGTNYPLIQGKSIGMEAQLLAQDDVIELSGIKMAFALA